GEPGHSVKRSKDTDCKVKSETLFNMEVPYVFFDTDQSYNPFMHPRMPGSSVSPESSVPAPSQSSAPAPSQSSAPAPSQSSAPAPSQSSAPAPLKGDRTDSKQQRLPIIKIVKNEENEYKVLPKPRDPLPKETSSDLDQTGKGGEGSSKSELDKVKKVSSGRVYEKAHTYAYVGGNLPKKTPESLSRESRHEKSEHGKKQKIPAETTETEHSSKTSFSF
ncbi:hypothetical protein TNCT_280181, partial [Trichonephila clavata]